MYTLAYKLSFVLTNKTKSAKVVPKRSNITLTRILFEIKKQK